MNHDRNISIVYIAYRLISGKRIASLYDLSRLKEVETMGLLDTSFLKKFDEQFVDYVPGYSSDCRYEFAPENKSSIEIFINGRTFMVHIYDTPTYFIGNVQGDTIYLYAHDESAHFKYRIIRYLETGGEV